MPPGGLRGKGYGRWAKARMARLVEPTVLYLLASGRAQHGYEIMQAAQFTPLADGPLDPGAVYRALRSLERDGCVVSAWQPGPAGPARRLYAITPLGLQRLSEWATVIEQRAAALAEFAQACRETLAAAGNAPGEGSDTATDEQSGRGSQQGNAAGSAEGRADE